MAVYSDTSGERRRLPLRERPSNRSAAKASNALAARLLLKVSRAT